MYNIFNIINNTFNLIYYIFNIKSIENSFTLSLLKKYFNL